MSAARSVRPQKPRTRTFRYSEDSRPSNRVPKDDRTLNPSGPQIELVRPKWNGAGPTTFRPLPMFCAEDPNSFDPTRLSLNPYDFSDFCRGYPAAKYVGIETKFTFITYDPRWPRESGYNPRTDNPFHVLYNALADAAKTGKAICAGKNMMTTEWVPLISSTSQEKVVSPPTKLYYFQGALFEHDGEIYANAKAPKGLGEEDLPQIIELSKTAGDDIASRLNAVDPNYAGETLVEQQDEMYVCGDAVDLKNGSFITVYNPDKHDVASAEPEKSSSKEFKSWCAVINREFSYVSKRQTYTASGDLTNWLPVIRDRLVWWDDIIYIPKTEEICVWLAQAFVQMPDMLHYAWTDNPEFFSDDVNGILSNRNTFSGSSNVMLPGSEEDDPPPKNAGRTAAPQSKAILPSAAAETPEEDFEETEDLLADDEVDDILRRAEQRANAVEPEPAAETAAPPKKKKLVKRVRLKKTDKSEQNL